MTRPNPPESLAEEHRALFRELKELASRKDATGNAVARLLEVLEPHFEEEELTAMPLLGTLRPLAEGKTTVDRAEIASLYAKFSSSYPRMLKEHGQVRELLRAVRRTADGTGENRVSRAMDELEHHARVEEEVLYPAALLAGASARGGG